MAGYGNDNIGNEGMKSPVPAPNYGGLGSNKGGGGKKGAYGGLGENKGAKGGKFQADAGGHPTGHHGTKGHTGHPTGHRTSHGGCPKCGASPCVCPP